MVLLHGTAVALDGKAIFLRGKSGGGKSDLALRLMTQGASLIADDQVIVTKKGNFLWTEAPIHLRGLLEIRGIGIFRHPFVARGRLSLVVDVQNSHLSPEERLPQNFMKEWMGVCLKHISLCAFEASASSKINFALHHHPISDESHVAGMTPS